MLEFLLGALASFVSSVVFIFLLSQIRPKIKICDKVAYVRDGNPKPYFQIKVINESPRAALEVRWQLHSERPDTARGEDAWIIRRIPLVTDEIFALTARSGYNDGNTFYFTVRTKSDVDLFELFDDEKTKLRFRVLCRDEYTQFSALKTQYFNKTDIVEGIFNAGYCETIRPIGGTNVGSPYVCAASVSS